MYLPTEGQQCPSAARSHEGERKKISEPESFGAGKGTKHLLYILAITFPTRKFVPTPKMANNKRQARDESEDEQGSSSKCTKSSVPITPKKARKTAAASNPDTPSKQAWDADQGASLAEVATNVSFLLN